MRATAASYALAGAARSMASAVPDAASVVVADPLADWNANVTVCDPAAGVVEAPAEEYQRADPPQDATLDDAGYSTVWSITVPSTLTCTVTSSGAELTLKPGHL